MATYGEIKKEVKEKLMCAIKDRKGSVVARHCNVPRSTIHSFVRQGSASPHLVLDICDWLSKHGYMQPPKEDIVFDDPAERDAFKMSLLTPDKPKHKLTVGDAKTILRDFLEISDSGIITDDQFWRLLRINIETLLREMPVI
jgi:hypothetical protein